MRKFLLICILISTGILIWGLLSGKQWIGRRFESVQKITDIRYGLSSEEVLDLYFPMPRVGRLPGIVVIHGGGWFVGDKHDWEERCTSYAAHGFVVANINYRLVKPDDVLTQWPAQLQDVQLAVRWIKAHASEFNVDSQRLCAIGDSSGGHLALLLGLLREIELGDRAGLLPQQSPQVSCVVDEFGPTDLTSDMTKYVKQNYENFLRGETVESNRLLYEEASPFFRLNKDSAPTLIVHGDADQVVLISQSQKMFEALRQKGIKVDMIRYHGGHAFAGVSLQERAQIREKELDFIRSVVISSR